VDKAITITAGGALHSLIGVWHVCPNKHGPCAASRGYITVG
jgi:hypothetical protein